MAIHAKQFPLTMASLSGGPMFSTDITVGKNKHESRNANWQDALWKYNAAYAVKKREDVEVLQAFFLSCYGREIAFNLQAGDDYQIETQSIGTGDGSDNTFQIYKTYTEQGFTYNRTITRPSATASDLTVIVNSVPKTHSTHYTYSTTTGIITFTGGNTPGVGHSVVINLQKFYVPVRFDVDELDIDMLNWWVANGSDYSLHQIPVVPMVEVRD